MISNQENVTEELSLIHQTLQGNPEAFRKIIEKHQNYIYDLCMRMLNHRQDAEDISQETFLRLYQHLPQYKVGYKLSNWIYTIALNLCRNHLRKRKIIRFFSLDHLGNPEEEKSLEIPSLEPAVDQKMVEQEEELFIEKLVMLLPDSYKAPFILRYMREIPDEEIASTLGLSISNVRIRIHRAKIFLWEKVRESHANKV